MYPSLTINLEKTMTLIVALLFALTTIMLVLLYTDSTIVPTGSIDLGRMNLLKGGE